MARVEIPLSKTRISLMILGSVVFVLLGIWFIVDPPDARNVFWSNPVMLRGLGIVTIVFFGYAGLVLMRKLTEQQPGLVVDETGITDYSSGLSGGHVAWTDIQDILILQIQRQKMVMILVRDPEAFIQREKSAVKRKLMAVNYRSYGSPWNISANSLQISFDDLYQLLTDHFVAAQRA